MTYDQAVLLSIPILIAAGALAAAGLGSWLYPSKYADGKMDDHNQKSFDFYRADPPDFSDIARKAKTMGTASAPGYVSADEERWPTK